MVNESLKEEVRKLVSEAKTLALYEYPKCDVLRLSYLLGDISEARGAAALLYKLHPEDAEIKQIWKDAAGAQIRGYKSRDKFHEECECKTK